MKKPAIISFLKTINFKKINSEAQRYSLLREKLGEEKSEELFMRVSRRHESEKANDGGNRDDDFYAFKNQDDVTSMAISNAFDGNFYIEVGRWIETFKEDFGNTILDVGCDCGILTCFIATLLPQAKVVGIDRNASAIAVASRLAKKLKLTNVSFDVAEMSTITPGSYETIFTSRTAHENGEYDKVGNLSHEDEFDAMTEAILPFYQSYAHQIARLMGEETNLIKISREVIGARYLARLLAFQNAGLRWVPETYFPAKIVLGNEEECLEEFQCVVFEKGEAVEHLKQDYLDFFFAPKTGVIETERIGTIRGSLAKIYFAYLEGEPMFGYEVFSKEGGMRIVKFMCYTGKQGQIFGLCAGCDGSFQLFTIDAEDLDPARQHVLQDLGENWLLREDVVVQRFNL